MPSSQFLLRSADRMTFHAPRQLGQTRRITPDGFLVCEGVPIARTGQQQYRSSELLDENGRCPLQADGDGIINVSRTAAEVFRPETMASFNGKPITIEHPAEFVTPENFKRYSVGTVNNVRRAPAPDDDLLLGDLLITDATAIHHVNVNFPELSAGYNSEYVQTGLGKAIQRGIVGNHVAMVNQGRAGPRVAFRDSIPSFDSAAALFIGAVRASRDRVPCVTRDFGRAPRTPDQQNEINRSYWKDRGVG